MSVATYSRDVPERTQTKVRSRYEGELRQLSHLGFSELLFYSEVLRARPSSLAILALMALRREVLSRHGWLRPGASYLLMQHQTPFTVALPMGLGIKFYTPFTDGYLLITTTFPSEALPAHGRAVEKHSDNTSIEVAWQRHGARANHAIGPGRATRRLSSFEEFVAVSQQEETSFQPIPSPDATH